MRDAVKEAMAASSGKLKSDAGVMYAALPSNATKLIPIQDFGFQYLMHSRGFLGGRILDIIGADGVGKSTLVFSILGWAMRHNIPSWYVETEGKPVVEERVVRCLHPDRKIAKQMFDALQFTQAFELTDAIDQIERWILTIRNPKSGAGHVPKEIPCIVVLDTFSKLMAPAEAVAYDFYKKGGATGNETEEEKAEAKKEEKAKGKGKPKGGARQKKEPAKQELMGGSNMQHAKIAHKWCRRLPSLLTFNNCLLIIVRHQNDKVDMSGGGGSFIPLEAMDSYNRTSIGGKAFNQSGAYQLILTKEKFEFAQIRGERKAVAQINKMQLAKNSYGPNRRILRYSVVMEPRRDTETHHEMALDFSTGLADILSQTGLVSVRIKSASNIAVKELSLDDATPQQVSEALHQRPDLVEDLGRRLQFAGYGSVNFEVPDMNPAFAPSKGEPESE